MKVNDIKKYIEDNALLAPGQHIVMGLSGGPDSVCLFHALLSLSEEWDLTLHPVHINHQIRPEGAEHDQKYVEALCAQHGLPCTVVTFDCEAEARARGLTTEEAGRQKRYQAFDEEALKLSRAGLPKERIRIATAHNADDQVETVLLRLIRGTGPGGLAGIEARRRSEAGFAIIRPLLFADKDSILAYCDENGLDPCIDSTNAIPLYMRNRVRLALIPYLEEYNPGIREAVLRLAHTAAEEKAYLDAQALSALDDAAAGGTASYDVKKLNKLPDAVRHRAVLLALKRAGLTEDAGFSHLKLIDQILQSENPSASADLPHGYRAVREYDRLALIREAEAEKPLEIRCSVMEVQELAALVLPRGSYAAFDHEALREAYGADFVSRVEWRSRKDGDYIAIPGGRKKLQDLFVDVKVPRYRRDAVRFCAIGKEVLWIPEAEGFPRGRYTCRYSLSEDTKTAFLVEVCKDI